MFCGNDVVFCVNDEVFCWNDEVFCGNDDVFCGNDVVFLTSTLDPMDRVTGLLCSRMLARLRT